MEKFYRAEIVLTRSEIQSAKIMIPKRIESFIGDLKKELVNTFGKDAVNNIQTSSYEHQIIG